MTVFINGSTRAVAEFRDRLPLGYLLSPHGGASPAQAAASGLPWAIDNGVFGSARSMADAYRNVAAAFPFPAFWATVAAAEALGDGARATLKFVVPPDVPGKGVMTAVTFLGWATALRPRGLPIALVGQDGMERLPWWREALGHAAAFFVGGSTAWKLSDAAAGMVAEAKSRGLWAHMGRVNSLARLKYAHSIGCDSVDGTGLTKFSRRSLPVLARYFDGLRRGPVFWDKEAS